MSAPGRDVYLDHELNRALDSCGTLTHRDSVGLVTSNNNPFRASPVTLAQR